MRHQGIANYNIKLSTRFNGQNPEHWQPWILVKMWNIAGGNGKCCSPLRRQFVLCTAKLTLTIQFSNFSPWYWFKLVGKKYGHTKPCTQLFTNTSFTQLRWKISLPWSACHWLSNHLAFKVQKSVFTFDLCLMHFLSELWFELRSSCLLSRHSTTWTNHAPYPFNDF
jgi:hypothetical protein